MPVSIMEMIPDPSQDQIAAAAAERILSRRDAILREQKDIKTQQATLAARERELDRELTECRAAARFFNLDFDPSIEEPDPDGLKGRIHDYLRRANQLEAEGSSAEAAARLRHRAASLSDQLQFMASNLFKPIEKGPLLTTDRKIAPNPRTYVLRFEERKIPKIRDIILDQLKVAGESGLRSAIIQKYIETAYSAQIHDKTVGMTLYRLSKELLVHRFGQTWFYGPPASSSLLVKPENPGVGTPGLINIPSE